MHLIGWLSLCCLVVFFSGVLICSFIWAIFLCWCACYVKGGSLSCSLGRGNAGLCAVTLYVGEGRRGSNGTHSTLHQISATPSATHNQFGPCGAGYQVGGLVHTSRPLWVSPRTSLVRLGVSPALAPTPMGIFNQRFEALFPGAGALGCAVCLASLCSPGLSVCECGAPGYYPLLCLPRSPPL